MTASLGEVVFMIQSDVVEGVFSVGIAVDANAPC